MNTSLPSVFIAAATVLLAAPLNADESYAVVQFMPTGNSLGYPEPERIVVPDAGFGIRSPGNENASGRARQAPSAPATAAAVPAKPKAANAAQGKSPLRYVTLCFGPLFGNAERGVDPNFLPPPMASYGPGVPAPSVVPVRYTKTTAHSPQEAAWVGADGSRITYATRYPSVENRGVEADDAQRPSVAEIIAENRREMTKISWGRVYRRYPELGREGSPERNGFEAYVMAKRADEQESETFESPMWPETVAAAFMTELTADRNWKKTEAESWDRVRSKVRIFNDPESVYTRRFMTFAEGLRADPEGAAIFREANWPEKALELHNKRLGEVPTQFR